MVFHIIPCDTKFNHATSHVISHGNLNFTRMWKKWKSFHITFHTVKWFHIYFQWSSHTFHMMPSSSESTLTVEGPIKHATVGKTLASRMSLVVLLALLNVSNHSLMKVGQISSHGMLTSLPCFLTEGASAAVRARLADGGNAEAISEMTTERNSIHCLSSYSESFSPPPSDNLHSLFIY